ncbi:sigma-70 family RNA polymerase sigma factor [Paenibacillus sinopodophylli]|uniref:sigma-70 family RNA polymerase sigma factor n=1 Tax=Paenibacillus sinopodophylli TaxID=1837342 RepID=UPI001486B629|nr:sigma factor [Paenibacillus sinopodophylli]
MNTAATQLENVIDQHHNLIGFVVRRYRWAIGQHGITSDDLESEAMIGMIKAHHRFDPSRLNKSGHPVRFASFAIPYILGEVRDFLKKNQPLKVSRNIYELAGKILRGNLLDKPAAAITEEIPCNEVEAQRALKYLRESKPASLEAPVGEDSSTLADILPAGVDETAADVSLFESQLDPLELKWLELLIRGSDAETAAKTLNISTTRMRCLSAELRRKAIHFFDYKGGSTLKQLTKASYVALKEKGISDNKISKDYGISTSFIYESKKKWGIVGLTRKQGAFVEDGPAQPPSLSQQPPADNWQEKYEGLSAEYDAFWEQRNELQQENELLKALLKKYL